MLRKEVLTRAARGRESAKVDRTQENRLLIHLLETCADGDREAFARLYRLTSPKLYGLALRMLKQEARAQECLQDAFLNIWRNAAHYDPAKAAPMTWMISIIRHRALDLLRQRRPDVHLDEYEVAERSGYSDPLPMLSGEADALARCLDELRDTQRRCLLLAYYEGLTHPELAARMDTPLGTVKTWIRRGLEQMKQCLER